MLYDGVKLNDSMRVIQCPKCKNEEFSDESNFCRICGTEVFNHCEGDVNEYGFVTDQHRNSGNARFCEICGKPTYFYKIGILKAWDKIEDTIVPFDL